MNIIRRLLCHLGMHGPEWGGHGPSNSGPSNAIAGPGQRLCKHCGAKWGAYEAVSNSPYRRLAWVRIYPNTQGRK